MSCKARLALRFVLLLSPLPILLSSCGGGGGSRSVTENRSNRGYNPGVGPFDSSGNYVERWADDKSKGRKWRRATAIGSQTEGAIADVTPPLPRIIASNNTDIPEPSAAPPARTATPVARAAPPKPAVKAKPKRKAPIRHTIKKGDTLWALSRKYGTTVTAIQRANGLKGTNLKIGRRLLIPRY